MLESRRSYYPTRGTPARSRLRTGGPCTILSTVVQRDARCSAPRCAHFASRHARKTPASCRARSCRPPANASAPPRRFFLDGVAHDDAVAAKIKRQAESSRVMESSDDGDGALTVPSCMFPSRPASHAHARPSRRRQPPCPPCIVPTRDDAVTTPSQEAVSAQQRCGRRQCARLRHAPIAAWREAAWSTAAC